MKRILILFAHPALQKSRINSQIIGDLKQLEFVTFHDLYQRYPEFDIDVAYEQKLLSQHDVIVFQHPFFWYSTPAILKEWQDLVLEHGWAYGRDGNALQGKIFFNIITTGGGADAYTQTGFHKHTVKMLLAPIKQTAKLCKMIFLPPFVIHGTHSISPEELVTHKNQLIQLLSALAKDKLDVARAEQLDSLNSYPE